MKIVYAKKFVKKFAKHNRSTQKQIHQAIGNIPEGDIKLIVGKNSPKLYRLRVSKYRIIFSYADSETVSILMVDGRGDVYKKL